MITTIDGPDGRIRMELVRMRDLLDERDRRAVALVQQMSDRRRQGRYPMPLPHSRALFKAADEEAVGLLGDDPDPRPRPTDDVQRAHRDRAWIAVRMARLVVAHGQLPAAGCHLLNDYDDACRYIARRALARQDALKIPAGPIDG